jgi:predicted translin family RNA/ssDNA-binding protein
MEAISFQHYLETQRLITHREAQKAIPGGLVLTEDDYLLGLFDLVGELMRFAITSMATTGVLPGSRESRQEPGSERDILMDLRSLRSSFESLDTTVGVSTGSPLKRDVEKKMDVMKTCVEKVENAVYGMIVRGRERPKGWVPDSGGDDRAQEPGESY